MIELLGYEFMQNALLAGLLASLACGVIGSYVLVNRIVFISGGIAHAAYGGVGLAFLLGLPPLLGIFGFSLLAAIIMAAASLKAKDRVDAVIGALWAAGMALGIILVDLTPGYNVDLMSYLFGSILSVSHSDLWLMLAITVVVITLSGYFYHGFLAMAFDEEFARTRGVPVTPLYFLLLGLIGLAVVMLVQVVGLILIIALLSIPPAIAEKFSRSLGRMMLLCIGLNMIFIVTGLSISSAFNLTSGAAIILTATAGFFLAHAIHRLAARKEPAGHPAAARHEESCGGGRQDPETSDGKAEPS